MGDDTCAGGVGIVTCGDIVNGDGFNGDVIESTGDVVDDFCGDGGGVGGALKTNGRPYLFLDGTLTGMTSPCRSGSSNLMT